MSNWGYRKPKKQFVSFEQMIAWGLQQNSEDPTWGKFYNYARHFFSEAVKLFNGTYTYVDVDGNTHHYPNIGITEEDLLNHYFEEYGGRLAARPLEIGRPSILDGQPMDYEVAMSVVLDITYRKAQKFVLFNRYKYLTLINTIDLPYNPIENYRMVETGEDSTTYGKNTTRTGNITDTPTGSKSLQRTIDAAQVDHIVVEGPILLDNNSQFRPTIDETTGKMEINEIGFAPAKVSNSSASARTAGSEQGGTVGTTTSSISIDGSTATINATSTIGEGSTPTSTSYGTTYDDNSSEGSDRKLGKSTQTGTVGEAENISSTSSTDRIVNGRIESGNPSAFGYTDTESFTQRTDTKTYNNVKDQSAGTDTTNHSLTRSGNIGTTTTQQMIESEREVARFNIIDEFCKELNKQILLDVYNF